LSDVQVAEVSRQNESSISCLAASIWICPLFDQFERNFFVFFDDGKIKGSVTVNISGILELKLHKNSIAYCIILIIIFLGKVHFLLRHNWTGAGVTFDFTFFDNSKVS
jgi:hypothetical protein